jgi:hypothetical protein
MEDDWNSPIKPIMKLKATIKKKKKKMNKLEQMKKEMQ